MFLFLWLVIVLAALGFFLWSTHTLFEQKKTWKKFAKNNDLQYFPGKMMDAPSMTGTIKGYKVNFYGQIFENGQGQKSTKNVIEVFLNKVPYVLCVTTSSGFMDFIESLELSTSFNIDDINWPKDIIARTSDEELAHTQDYITNNDNIIDAVQKLSKFPFDTTFVCDGDQAFVAIRTPHPFDKDKQLSVITKKLIHIVNLLEAEPTPKQAEDNPSSPEIDKTDKSE